MIGLCVSFGIVTEAPVGVVTGRRALVSCSLKMLTTQPTAVLGMGWLSEKFVPEQSELLAELGTVYESVVVRREKQV